MCIAMCFQITQMDVVFCIFHEMLPREDLHSKITISNPVESTCGSL